MRTRDEEPYLPEDVQPADLERTVRAHLRALPRAPADSVARHLVMAARLAEDDPALAHRHAQYAVSLGGRLAAVREVAGIMAYRAGDFATALSDLRTHRRLTGSAAHLPVIADCERAAGRPERAVALAGEIGIDRLAIESQVEMRIVVSGARRDLGQLEASLVALEGRFLEDTSVHDWTTRLWYAYAEALLALGRTDDAQEWFAAAAQVDVDDTTDAAERVLELGGTQWLPDEEEDRLLDLADLPGVVPPALTDDAADDQTDDQDDQES